jgi:hypothetical protein
MPGVTESRKNIELIDLTEDDNIKKEPSLDNQYQSSTSQYTCKIIIENTVSLCTIEINILHRKNRNEYIGE